MAGAKIRAGAACEAGGKGYRLLGLESGVRAGWHCREVSTLE